MRGTANYIAPELLRAGQIPASGKADMYSFSRIVLDYLTNSTLKFASTGKENFRRIGKNSFYRPLTIEELLPEISYLPEELIEFLMKIGCNNPEDRCDAREALELLDAMIEAKINVFPKESDEFGQRPTEADFEHKAQSVGLTKFNYNQVFKSCLASRTI